MEEDWEKERIHEAAQNGDLELVRSLISEGADVNYLDELGKAPLHYAAESEHLEIVRALLQNGAEVDAHDSSQAGNTALREVASNCSYQMAELLIKHGADPTIPGWMQITALHKAQERKKPEGIKVYELLAKAARKGV